MRVREFMPYCSQADINLMFHAADLDSDGSLNQEEFLEKIKMPTEYARRLYTV